MNDEQREIFTKAKIQGDKLLKDACLNGREVHANSQRILTINKAIIEGKLKED